MSYPESLRALNHAAWDAVHASKGIVTTDHPDYQALRALCRETDRLVDELVLSSSTARAVSHLGDAVPVLQSAMKGASLS